MRIHPGFGAVALALLIAPSGAGGSAAALVRANVSVVGATPPQAQMTRWAVQRFEWAGLQVPSVEVGFHTGTSGCRGHLGYALAGHVDLCTTSVNAMGRWLVLHEMGHIWLDENTTSSVRDRFLEVRGLRRWNASSDPWSARGYEQGAEVMAWALGERILTPKIPDNDPGQLGRAYVLLTGKQAPS